MSEDPDPSSCNIHLDGKKATGLHDFIGSTELISPVLQASWQPAREPAHSRIMEALHGSDHVVIPRLLSCIEALIGLPPGRTFQLLGVWRP